MSMNNAAETALLKLWLQNVNFANVGDATGMRGSSTPGFVYVRLHSADPGEAGNATTNEVTFTGYAAAQLARSSGVWDVTNNIGSNIAEVQFAECTAGTAAATHFSISDAATGAGNWMLSGALNATLNISAGITPRFAAGVLQVTAG